MTSADFWQASRILERGSLESMPSQMRPPDRSPGVRCSTSCWALSDLPASLPNEYRASESIASLPNDDGLLSDFCSSSPTLAYGFLPTIPRDTAVAFSL